MPKGVVVGPKQEKMWRYATKQVEKQTSKKASKFTDTEWRRVNFIFQKAKKKYKGKLPKKYTEAGFKEAVFANYNVKPLEHFDSSGTNPFWSIQTERTHGRKGIIRVSRSHLEDPKMAMKSRNDYTRMAGAEDIYQGSKEGLMSYIKNTYKEFKTIEFA
jgi:hypothetical protein